MHIIPSKLYNYNRLINTDSGKSVMVAMDHTGGGIFPGLEDYEPVLKEVIAASPDAIMLNIAIVRHFNHLFKGREAPAIIAAIDLNMMADKLPEEMMQEGQNLGLATVEEAVRYGASAVKVLMTWGQVELEMQHRAFERIGYWSQQCARWNIPFIVEPNLWGKKIPKSKYNDPVMLGDTARIAVEMGADALKIDVPEDIEELKRIIKSCFVPVFLLGGSKGTSAKDFLERVNTTMNAGAAGVVIGRSVWQAKDIYKMVQALKLVVYEGKLEEGIKLACEAY
jgi:class I fructose-bisphosphate aldolase